MSLDIEVVIGGPNAVKHQVNQEEVAAVLQLVVPTL
jgi:hypothetical protein